MSSKIRRANGKLSYVDVKLDTTLNTKEVVGAFLLWMDYAEEAHIYRCKPTDSWPEVSPILVRMVAEWALYQYGIRGIQGAASLDRKGLTDWMVCRIQEVKRYLHPITGEVK